MLLMALTAPALAVAETISHTITLNNSNLAIGIDTLGGVVYTTINYTGLDNHGIPGAPSLPVDYIKFSVPYNATNFTVTATTKFPLESNIPHMVYPCQAPRLFNDTSAWTVTLPDSSIYFSGTYYPANLASVVDEGYLAGENHIVTVAVTPYSCIHVNNGTVNYKKIRKPQSITVKLTYQTGGNLQTEPIVRRDTVLRNEGFELARSMVVNPNAVRMNAVPDTSIYMQLHGFVSPGQSYPVDSTATYLIVTTQEFKHSLRRLAALKRQKGYSVKVVTMDEVLASPYCGEGDRVLDENGNYCIADTSDAGKLREYLRYCFNNLGTKYVLLAGTNVPYKSVSLVNKYTHELFDATTDLCYSCLNGNWYNGDIDYSHELHVGRILSKTETQIVNYTDKLLRYELDPGNGDRSYLKRAFFLEGRSFRNILNYAKSKLSPYFPNHICINDEITDIITGKDIIDTLRTSPVGIAIPFNHGDTTRILVYGEVNLSGNHYIHALRDEGFGNGLNCLNNKDYPMIFYVPSCTTIPYSNVNGINFGESFITGEGYGGPVYIGYTATDVAETVKVILNNFIRKLISAKYVLGVADSYSKDEYSLVAPEKFEKKPINDLIVHSYLGDPSIELWTDIPQEYSNISITRTENSITVSGLDVDSTIVAYCDNNYHAGYRLTSSTSLTLNSVSPNSTIMLYKHNHLPYIAPLALQNININNSQYVIASDVTAGINIDHNRLAGNVVIKSGTEYEIEATGTVTLDYGFKVEKGATFAVYPACF